MNLDRGRMKMDSRLEDFVKKNNVTEGAVVTGKRKNLNVAMMSQPRPMNLYYVIVTLNCF